MRARVDSLSHARLLDLLFYDPETGVFTWRVNRIRAKAGTRAGSVDAAGYRVITIDQVWYKAHRLAWFYVHGEWPPDQLDHKDRDRGNNRLSNLRPATNALNQINRPARGRSGISGVSWHSNRGKWQVSITIDGSRRYIGTFMDKAEASAVRHQAELNHFGEFACLQPEI